MTTDDTDKAWLGEQIRNLRKQRGLSLEDLQAATGRSIGFLSQLERGKSRASVDDLVRISATLGIPFPALFYSVGGGERGIVMRQENRPRLSYRNGISDYLLSPNLGGKVEVLLTTFEPGATSGDELFQDDEGLETGFVIAGELELWVEETSFHLNTGDSFSYPGQKPHRYLNPTERPTQVVWVISRA
jgi:transcriptional regulator with XRE-family HTH domain